MTPERLRACLHALEWWTPEMAEAANIDDRIVRRWMSGKIDIPPEFGAWVEALVRYALAHKQVGYDDADMINAHPPPPRPARRFPASCRVHWPRLFLRQGKIAQGAIVSDRIADIGTWSPEDRAELEAMCAEVEQYGPRGKPPSG